jgi:hypothetical protein
MEQMAWLAALCLALSKYLPRYVCMYVRMYYVRIISFRTLQQPISLLALLFLKMLLEDAEVGRALVS